MSNHTKTPPQSLPSLLASAAQKGTISPATSALLTGNLGAVVIAGAAGKDAEDIVASDRERRLRGAAPELGNAVQERGGDHHRRRGRRLEASVFSP